MPGDKTQGKLERQNKRFDVKKWEKGDFWEKVLWK